MTAKTSVSIRDWRGAPAVTLTSGDLEATFLPGLGMLGASLMFRGRDFLALPGGLSGYRRLNQTGLPLLAPWANRLGARRYRVGRVRVDASDLELHTDQSGLPIHGTMTARPGWAWGFGRWGRTAELHAGFDYDERVDLFAAFPFPHRLEVRAAVDGTALSVTTTLEPTERRAVPVSFGYHPYFRLPGSPRASWRLLLPALDHLLLDPEGLPTGERVRVPAEAAPIRRRTFDDLFALRGSRRLGIEDRQHSLVVRLDEGYPFAQVWVPPGKQFACLEPMTAPVNALVTGECRVVSPGESFRARFTVTVRPVS